MTLKKAIIRAWSSGTYTAAIQIGGSARAYLEGVAVARHIPAAEMVIGRQAVVVFWDRHNAADAVIIAVYV